MLGGEVGYSIRFDDCSDKTSTRIKVNKIVMCNIKKCCLWLSLVFDRWYVSERDHERSIARRLQCHNVR